jgi:hypothetical protein
MNIYWGLQALHSAPEEVKWSLARPIRFNPLPPNKKDSVPIGNKAGSE